MTRLDGVELAVTDLERSARFYRDAVGLQPLQGGDPAKRHFRCGADGARLVLRRGAQAGLCRVRWSLPPLPWAALRDSVEPGARSKTLQIDDPGSGAVHEFACAPAYGRAVAFRASHTRIERIGHVVVATPRADESTAYFRQRMCFLESDRIEHGTVFLRPPGSPWHHGLGIARAPWPRLHHVNFMVSDIDDIGRALHRFQRHAVPVVFGPGRHPASGSVFLYFLDPDGLTLEYSFGMEMFDGHQPRAGRCLPKTPASVDAWGAPRDPRMGRQGVIHAR